MGIHPDQPNRVETEGTLKRERDCELCLNSHPFSYIIFLYSAALTNFFCFILEWNVSAPTEELVETYKDFNPKIVAICK